MKQTSLPQKCPLRSLHPLIDEHGLVRVGRRLEISQPRFNSKHSIILPSQHTISELLFKEQHIPHLLAGPTLLAYILRQSHGIVGSRKVINKCITKCLQCNKFKISTTTPQPMDNLSKHQVMLERSFFSCGDVLLLVPRSFIQPPTKEIVGSCYRISKGAFGRRQAPTFSLHYNLARNSRTYNKIGRKMTSCSSKRRVLLVYGQRLEFFNCIQATTE
ncbi:hypothetical protein TNCT_12311 [Trichonephila clavata]|uniref:Integrase zinc-binding domain-containing protein n=1 Tax=Trichonephila clavata TaxID=2740835 RepID=A0A8X6HGY1_TRICU|nr:hypothetical protein TNCT_12311 [Trichonephila clavata]